MRELLLPNVPRIKRLIFQPFLVPVDIAVEVLLDVRLRGWEGLLLQPFGLRGVVCARGGVHGGVEGRVDVGFTLGVGVGALVGITIVEIALV